MAEAAEVEDEAEDEADQDVPPAEKKKEEEVKPEVIHNEVEKKETQERKDDPVVDVSKNGMTEIIVHRVRHIKRKNCTDIRYSPFPLPKTALASFPGSGNTWARHLIQLASGKVKDGIANCQRLCLFSLDDATVDDII